MTILLVLAVLAMVVVVGAIAAEVSIRNAYPDVGDEPRFDRTPVDHDGSALVPWQDADIDDEPIIYTIYEADELLALDHLRGMEVVDELLRQVAEAVHDARRSPRRRPRRPTSILLHGPSGGAMTILSHQLARRFRARLVQLFASKALPSRNGGVQPRIAAVVNQARDHLPSVLMIDQFEYVAAGGVRDADRHRTANDLIGEALRPVYGASHVVVAVFTVYDGQPVPRRVADVFEHVVAVDAPQLERALRLYALRTADGELYRAISGARLAEHPDIAPPWDSAA